MSRYQVDFEFRDAEEELTPLGTVSISVGREFYEGMVNSKIVRFAGHLFCYEDNTPESAPDHALRCVRMVEAIPALPSAFDSTMRPYDDYAPPAFCAALKDTTQSDDLGLVRYGVVAHDDGSDRMEPVARGQWVRADEAAAAIERLVAERDEAERVKKRMAKDWLDFCEAMGVRFDTHEAVAYSLGAEWSKLEAQRDKLKEALEFYADPEGWKGRFEQDGPSSIMHHSGPVLIDRGARARQTLGEAP